MTQQQQRRPQPSPVGSQVQGVIRSLQEAFGFIEGDDGCEYFFHKSGLQATTFKFHELCDGKRTKGPADRVAFTVIDHPKGPRAIEVRVLEATEPR
jgi:cold shock CspA family protein